MERISITNSEEAELMCALCNELIPESEVISQTSGINYCHICAQDLIPIEFEIGNKFRTIRTIDMNEPSGYLNEEEWTAFVRIKNPKLNAMLQPIINQVQFKLGKFPELKRKNVYVAPLKPFDNK